ncbi:hypothetical protein N9M66_04390 [Litoreibacter sp.]|jgi:hypothetical protein|nr:hypothetical protein [Litoreibacter sp.]
MAVKPSEKSLSNLEKIQSSEMANEYRLRGLETRRKNKEQRELAKNTIMAMKSMGDDAPNAIEALNYVLVRAMEDDDSEQIVKVASILAEYQAPKLSRQDVTQTNIDAGDLSDEELQAELDKLGSVH